MRKVGLIFLSLPLIVVFIAGCAQPSTPPEEKAPPSKPEILTPSKESEQQFVITSPAFAEGEKIPVKYTCNGQNISPPLDWSQEPAGTAALALIMDDPDAPIGVFTHWVIFNLPQATQKLPEAIPPEGKLASGALQGKNGFGKIGYFGPCPPPGAAHRYRFAVYALDKLLDLVAGASKEQVLEAMKGHILAQVQLVGTYQR